jgi:hypothetical protein
VNIGKGILLGRLVDLFFGCMLFFSSLFFIRFVFNSSANSTISSTTTLILPTRGDNAGQYSLTCFGLPAIGGSIFLSLGLIFHGSSFASNYWIYFLLGLSVVIDFIFGMLINKELYFQMNARQPIGGYLGLWFVKWFFGN